MPDYSFRLRFRIADSCSLRGQVAAIDLAAEIHPGLVFKAQDRTQTIEQSKLLVLTGSGHASEAEAISVGVRMRDAMTLAFSYCRIGADFGDRAGRSGITQAGLRMLVADRGGRVLPDTHGLMAFETDPPPEFVSLGGATITLSHPFDRFVTAFSQAARSGHELSTRERLAYELFSASMFEPSPDTRFILLVMSVEVLLEPQQRRPAVVDFVKALSTQTSESAIPKAEKESILGALRWLQRESIRQSARRLVSTRLPDACFEAMPASEFFLRCYDLRSHLVHGNQPYPSRDRVSRLAAPLEVLVSRLIASAIEWPPGTELED